MGIFRFNLGLYLPFPSLKKLSTLPSVTSEDLSILKMPETSVENDLYEINLYIKNSLSSSTESLMFLLLRIVLLFTYSSHYLWFSFFNWKILFYLFYSRIIPEFLSLSWSFSYNQVAWTCSEVEAPRPEIIKHFNYWFIWLFLYYKP